MIARKLKADFRMRIALYQMDCRWEDAASNRAGAEKWIASQRADLFVLPEMFTTGFTMAPDRVAESGDGETAGWLCDMARHSGAAVAGSVAVRCDGGTGDYRNRFFFARPDGALLFYDKRHLFRMGGEGEHYRPGGERVVVEYRGWRILLQVCYDLRFPVWSRNRNDYDMILYVASWPASRAHAWRTLLAARAIENQCYVAGVNRVGRDPSAVYSGDSAIFDFKGEPVAAADPYREQSVVADLNLETLRTFREKFPAFLDADRFEFVR